LRLAPGATQVVALFISPGIVLPPPGGASPKELARLGRAASKGLEHASLVRAQDERASATARGRIPLGGRACRGSLTGA
jgi:hypothetical protein